MNLIQRTIAVFHRSGFIVRCITIPIMWMITCGWIGPTMFAQDDVVLESDSVIHPIDWSTIGRRAHHLQVTVDPSGITLTTEGRDPYFYFDLPKLQQTEKDWILQWQYFCPQGVTNMQWRSGKQLHHPDAIELPPMQRAEGWTTYRVNLTKTCGPSIHEDVGLTIRIDLGDSSGLRLQVRDVVVRPMLPREQMEQQIASERDERKRSLAQQIDSYQTAEWPAKIESVAIDDGQIHLSGSTHRDRFSQSNDSAGPIILVTRRPESIAAEPASERELMHTWPIIATAGASPFQISIPSPVGSSWLDPGVRFQLYRRDDDQWVPISAAVYPVHRSLNEIAAPPRLAAAKGLTCITSRFKSDELRDLGLKHASVNLVISGIVSPSPRNGWEKMDIRGTTWWVDQATLRRQDKDILTATDAGAVVAGILLLPVSRRAQSPMVHPESTDDGTYAMPNLVDGDAIHHYAAALHVLGERYSGRHPEYGRIDHWIVHNEVDYGWQWTNMGMQPFEIFMDHYVRSMRLVDRSTRPFNPHAKVLISLTHRWNTTDNQKWKTYAPREMIRWLIRDCELAGDFPWGVAYHPYPQSLWKADVWNDTQITDDFETPLITIKNLQVLDRWMHQPECLTSEGQVRAVICSEQGFHADPQDQDQLQIQSAALLYTWDKLRQCPSIIAFDYHRPSDHPHEGGLRLGLRGLPGNEDPLGLPKPAWEVYRAIGTDSEADLRLQYQHLWQSSGSSASLGNDE